MSEFQLFASKEFMYYKKIVCISFYERGYKGTFFTQTRGE